MPAVFYTNRKFPTGQTFDTRDYCETNQRNLLDYPEAVIEVEEYLEMFRLEAQKQIGIELPSRLCSILVFPSPMRYEMNPRKTLRAQPTDLAPDPAGEGRYCYYVIPKAKTKRLMVDERWVYELIANWEAIAGTGEAHAMAWEYWNGQMFRIGEGTMSFLYEGPVFVESICRMPYRVGA